MSKQPRLRPHDALQPVPCPSVMSSQSLVFLLGPSRQMVVWAAEGRVQRRAIVAAVVVEPPPEHRIKHPRQIVERLVTAPMHGPASHRVAHLLGRLRANYPRYSASAYGGGTLSFTFTDDLPKVFRPLEAQSGDQHDASHKSSQSQHVGR